MIKNTEIKFAERKTVEPKMMECNCADPIFTGLKYVECKYAEKKLFPIIV